MMCSIKLSIETVHNASDFEKADVIQILSSNHNKSNSFLVDPQTLTGEKLCNLLGVYRLRTKNTIDTLDLAIPHLQNTDAGIFDVKLIVPCKLGDMQIQFRVVV